MQSIFKFVLMNIYTTIHNFKTKQLLLTTKWLHQVTAPSDCTKWRLNSGGALIRMCTVIYTMYMYVLDSVTSVRCYDKCRLVWRVLCFNGEGAS